MQYMVNNVIVGKISGITNYGIFVEVDNNYTGLIHISELSDLYVSNIYDYGKVGDNIKAKIISINENEKKIQLSIKKMNECCISGKNVAGFKTLYMKRNFWIQDYLKNKKINKYY